MTGIEAAAAPALLKLAADLLKAIQKGLRRGKDHKLVSAATRELLSSSPDIPRAEAALAEVKSKPRELFRAVQMLKQAKRFARKSVTKKKRPQRRARAKGPATRLKRSKSG
jgi:DNA mismatch repair ATPase MutS